MSLLTRIVLPSARLHCPRPASQRLCRPFSTALYLQRPMRSSRVTNQTKPQPQIERREEAEYEKKSEGNRRNPPLGARSGRTVTWGIIGVCGSVFIYHAALQAEVVQTKSIQAVQKLKEFQKNFVMTWEGIQNGRHYTLLTSTLMHNSLGHIAFNMLALYGFAPSIITLFGLQPFTILFVGSAVTGGVVQYWLWNKNKDYQGAAVGASGAIFGIITALTCVMPRHSILLMFVPMPMWAAAGISVVASVAGLQGYWGPGIGHADHLGGMAFGAVFWSLVLRKRPGGFMPYYP